jgi:hypothetical protein
MAYEVFYFSDPEIDMGKYARDFVESSEPYTMSDYSQPIVEYIHAIPFGPSKVNIYILPLLAFIKDPKLKNFGEPGWNWETDAEPYLTDEIAPNKSYSQTYKNPKGDKQIIVVRNLGPDCTDPSLKSYLN